MSPALPCPSRPGAPTALLFSRQLMQLPRGVVGRLGVRGCACSARRCRGPRCSVPAPIAPLTACTRASPPRAVKPVIPGPGTAVSAANSPAWPIGQSRTRHPPLPGAIQPARQKPHRPLPHTPCAGRYRLPCSAAAGPGELALRGGARGAAPGRLLPWTDRGRPARTAAGG